jgi:hypothetical protein
MLPWVCGRMNGMCNKEFMAELIKVYFPTAQTSSPTNVVLLMSYLGDISSCFNKMKFSLYIGMLSL